MPTDRTARQRPTTQPAETVIARIQIWRGQRVLLDSDLAALYGVPTKALVQAVKRNLQRFPNDFMFPLSPEEFTALRSQTVTSKVPPSRGGRRTPPYAFTEQGVAMLSSVLNSERAVAVNIEVMRTFVRMRQLATDHAELAAKLNALEKKTDRLALGQDTFNRNTRQQLQQVFDTLRALMTPPEAPKRPIGFVIPNERPKD